MRGVRRPGSSSAPNLAAGLGFALAGVALLTSVATEVRSATPLARPRRSLRLLHRGGQ